MSEAAFNAEAMLERLAVLDMAAAEHVHAKLMAAETCAEVAELGRAYQRAARSVRQTLGVHARMRREAATDARRADADAERDALARERRQAREASDLAFRETLKAEQEKQQAMEDAVVAR